MSSCFKTPFPRSRAFKCQIYLQTFGCCSAPFKIIPFTTIFYITTNSKYAFIRLFRELHYNGFWLLIFIKETLNYKDLWVAVYLRFYF